MKSGDTTGSKPAPGVSEIANPGSGVTLMAVPARQEPVTSKYLSSKVPPIQIVSKSTKGVLPAKVSVVSLPANVI
jgi:hypothetical protein